MSGYCFALNSVWCRLASVLLLAAAGIPCGAVRAEDSASSGSAALQALTQPPATSDDQRIRASWVDREGIQYGLDLLVHQVDGDTSAVAARLDFDPKALRLRADAISVFGSVRPKLANDSVSLLARDASARDGSLGKGRPASVAVCAPGVSGTAVALLSFQVTDVARLRAGALPLAFAVPDGAASLCIYSILIYPNGTDARLRQEGFDAAVRALQSQGGK